MSNPMNDQIIKDSPILSLSQLCIASLIGSALILGTGSAWAGGGGHGHKHDPQSKMERMTKKLALTQEQQNNILPILQSKHEKMEALHNQMKEVRENAMSQVEAQLTPEQLEKFKKAKEERKMKRKEYKEKHGKSKGHKKNKHSKDDHHD